VTQESESLLANRKPMLADDAMALALAWADGARSYANLGWNEPYTPDVIAVMDAQEVVKWTAIAVALRALEKPA
jgi:hypothetical protein